MRSDFDVIVVGARVAGASTAMLLARSGHRVLLVDRAKMPSDTVSTHAMTRTGALQLMRWGLLERVAEVTPPIRDIVLGFGPERIRFDVRPEHGVEYFVAPRRIDLDQIILGAAEEAGVEFLPRTTVTDLVWSASGAANGVVAGGETITASMVIGADGVWSKVAQLVGAVAHQQHRPLNAVNYAYFENLDAPGFWFQFTPGVNAGLITTGGGQVCVFAGRPAEVYTAFQSDPDGEFERLIALAGSDLHQMVAGGRRVSPYRGTRGLPGFIRQPWGPGWALVGDSGYTKDPISAHGISDALRDAEFCARAADRALVSPDESVEAFSWYHRMRDSLSQRMYENSRELARFRWDSQRASDLMRGISVAVDQECEALEALPEWRGSFSQLVG